MMSGRSKSAVALSVLAGLIVVGCGRSPLPSCPKGFALDNTGECACASDSVCPDNLSCIGGVCRCTSSACCPEAYTFIGTSSAALLAMLDGGTRTSSDPGRCICRKDECCPKGTRFEHGSCVCRDSSCCPPLFDFDPVSLECTCKADGCCPMGFSFDSTQGKCSCAADVCCPLQYRWDDARKGCTCADDSCCPPQHRYDPISKACICTGVGCCPDGFQPTLEGGCMCARDSACPAGLHCDTMSGRCVCMRDQDCGPTSFCNRIGFCQSLNACATNGDCPSSMFCYETSAQCFPMGICIEDYHCPLGEICDAASGHCMLGCRTTADCNLLDVCIMGACLQNRCPDSSYCGPREFCNLMTMTCGPVDNRFCQPCDMSCALNNGTCLTEFVEGTHNPDFCGIPCMVASDCPGDLVCDDSYNVCSGPGDGICEPHGLACIQTAVLNQPNPEFLCSDPSTMEPKPTGKFCSPRSGVCAP
jgi:hypothetical protein